MTTNRILKEALDAALEVAHLLAYAHPEYMDKINRALTLIETTQPVGYVIGKPLPPQAFEVIRFALTEHGAHEYINNACDEAHELYEKEAASWVVRALYLAPQE